VVKYYNCVKGEGADMDFLIKGAIFVLGLIIVLFLVGVILLQRERYWFCIWQELGMPDLKSTKELKRLYKKYRSDNKKKH